MFLGEIKRGFCRLSFKSVMLITTLACVVSAFQFQVDVDLVNSYIKAYISSAYDEFIFFNLNPISNILIIILPLLSAISYADSYLEDLNSGFIKCIYTRHSKKKYLMSKFAANFLVSGVAFVVPLIINLVILLLRYKSVETNAILGRQTIYPGGLLPDLFYKSPLLYIGIWLAIYFLYAGAFSSIALSLSIFVNNKFVILILPFLLCNVSGIILQITDSYQYHPMSFLYLSLSQSLRIILAEFICITILSGSVFYFGGCKNEIY